MCSRYELNTSYESLQALLKIDPPKHFKEKYQAQKLIKPNAPVLVVKSEGKIATSFMLWGYISQWSKDPLKSLRPFNARLETVGIKKMFQASWRHKRCLIPATAFREKRHIVKRKDNKPFWLAGIWNRWMSSEGCEIESCCVLTTEPNELMKPIHNRMPVIISSEMEKKWLKENKNLLELKELEILIKSWSSENWTAERINKYPNSQLCLF